MLILINLTTFVIEIPILPLLIIDKGCDNTAHEAISMFIKDWYIQLRPQ